MLVKGTENTEYESYYITYDNIVKQTKNHSLTAVWTDKYTVTFDPGEGATIDYFTKEVAHRSPYGELPTPVKNGYNFVGWKGENLFDKEAATYGYEFDASYNIVNNSAWYITDYIEVEPNTYYTISGKTAGDYLAYYDMNKEKIINSRGGTNGTILVPGNNNIKYIRINGKITEKDTFEFIQGRTYYTTSDSIVELEKDHTLYAVWEANS